MWLIPRGALAVFFLALNKPAFRESLTAIRQIQALGYNPKDVRHIVLTHLDFDHAGGLDDFPWAKVHLLSTEKVHALKQQTWLDRQRFRPAQWSTMANWVTYHPGEGEAWHGFSRVHALDGLPSDIAMIPLIGHTLGHAGVAVKRGDKWLLQAGDAYMFHGEMNIHQPHCTPGLRFYQWMMEKDRKARLWNQARLRDLVRMHGNLVDVICSHDMVEYQKCAHQAAARAPAHRAGATIHAGA